MAGNRESERSTDRPQFSLRSVLIGVTGIGLLLGLIIQPFDFVALPILAAFLLLMPVVILIALVRGCVRGYGVAFCVGALFGIVGSLGFASYRVAEIMNDDPRMSFYRFSEEERHAHLALLMRGAALLQLMFSPALGIVAVGIRWGALRVESSVERTNSGTESNPLEHLLVDATQPRYGLDRDSLTQ
jgi:hypothetical protein